MADITVDSIWSADIRIAQPKRGYRFAVDAVLLAHFLKSEPETEALEIGAGCGVISILFSRLQPCKRLTAVEIQPELAELAVRNFSANGMKPFATVLEQDARELSRHFPSESFDLIFCNPPYRRVGAGKLNPNSQKAIARHELKMTLEDLFVCAGRLLKPSGRLSVILPDFRERDFRKLAEIHGFQLYELQYVHSFATEPPAFFLATAGKQPAPLLEHPPITLHR
jgi:tRNA1Val (adenine37-N6)-methyltransferase